MSDTATVDVAEAGDLIADKLESMSEPVEKVEPSIEASEEPEKDEPQPETDDTEISEEIEESEEDPKDDLETEEPEEDSTETFKTVTELAEALGMPLDEFMESIKLTTKVNGEESEVSLKDAQAGYQMEKDYRIKTTEHALKVKADYEQIEAKESQVQLKFQEASDIAANLEQQLMGEYNNIDWNLLENQDREEWLVQRQKFGERYQQLEGAKAKIQGETQQRNEQMQAQQEQGYREHIAKENELLLQAIPEWSDGGTREAEVVEMTDYLKQYGFSEEESNQISDHRIMRLIRDSYKSANKDQKIDVVKKKVKKLPKIVKPSAKTDKRTLKKKADANSWAKYKQSGSMDDLTAHLASKL